MHDGGDNIYYPFFCNASTLNNSLRIFTRNFKNSHSTGQTSHSLLSPNQSSHANSTHKLSKHRLHICLLHSGGITCQIQPWIDFRQISSKASSVPCRRLCCVAIRHTPTPSWEKFLGWIQKREVCWQKKDSEPEWSLNQVQTRAAQWTLTSS